MRGECAERCRGVARCFQVFALRLQIDGRDRPGNELVDVHALERIAEVVASKATEIVIEHLTLATSQAVEVHAKREVNL